jgi:hypothetical protein
MYYWTPKRLKELKAAGYKLHACPEAKVTSSKQQEPRPERPKVPSSKHQAASVKLQADIKIS